MKIHSFLADVLDGVHLTYMAVVIFGQLGIMIGWPLGWRWIRNPWFRVSHLAMILIVAVEAYCEFECPLTTWSRNLRIEAGQIPANFMELPQYQTRDLSFIGGLLRDVMYLDTSTWGDFLAWCYYAAAGIVVTTVILVPPRFRKLPAGPPPSEPAPSPASAITEWSTEVTAKPPT